MISLPKGVESPRMMWVGDINFSLASPLLQVDAGGVGQTPLWRILCQQPTNFTFAIHIQTAITTLAGPLVWLPIWDHSSSQSTVTIRTMTCRATKAMAGTTIGVPPPVTGILVVGIVGLTLKQLADSGRNQHNLTLALCPSMHAYVHWLLSWLQQSTRRVVPPGIVIILPSLLHPHIRFPCTNRMPRIRYLDRLKTSSASLHMGRNLGKSQTIVFAWWWKNLIVYNFSPKAQRSIVWISSATNSKPTFWKGTRPNQIGAKLPRSNNLGILLALALRLGAWLLTI